MKQHLVIYHGGNCPDGFTAAWAVRKAYLQDGIDADYFPAVYPPGGQPTELPIVSGRHVVMVDFCTSREQLLEIKEAAASLLVLDHHKSHEEACAGLDFCQFDMDRSGARMAWDHFHSDEEVPPLVAYVEDRDLWRFEIDGSRIVNAYIGCEVQTWENWDKLHHDLLHNGAHVEERGRGALAYLDHYVRQASEQARRIRVGPAAHEIVPIVNAPYIGTSELVGALAQGQLFAIGWFVRADGLVQYSLRSKGGYDLTNFAKFYGGGGHAAAAGFTTDKYPHELWEYLEAS